MGYHSRLGQGAHAVGLAEQVKAGVHIAEALGREIERRVGEPGLVLALRTAFPARPEWSGRRVCDGQQVLDAAVLLPGIDRRAFDDLRVALDTYADLLVTDALHDIVEGQRNGRRRGARGLGWTGRPAGAAASADAARAAAPSRPRSWSRLPWLGGVG